MKLEVWRVGLAAAWLALAQGSVAAPPAPKVFTERPSIERVVPSPSGRRVALLVAGSKGRNRLAVLDLPATAPPRAIGGFADADIERVRWVNDDRLVFEAAQSGAFIAIDGAGTVAIDHDGKNLQPLIAWRVGNAEIGSRLQVKLLDYTWQVLRSVGDGSADVIAVERLFSGSGEPAGSKLARVNTLTGARRTLGLGMPIQATDWVFDRRGEPRVVRTVDGGRDRLLLREGDGETWVTISDQPVLGNGGMAPLYLEDNGTLIVQSQAGRDTAGIYAYDLKARRLDTEPLVSTDRFDVRDVETDDRERRVVAAHLTTDRPLSVWFSPRMRGIQQAIDAALPGRFNTLRCGNCESSASYVVFSRSDRHPGEYLIYDPEKRALTRVGEVRPGIDIVGQGTRSFHWFKSSDGLALPLVLTDPPGRSATEPLPTVVLVHGGPWVRGASRVWDAEAQFLATRGWRVLQPEFRGATGFGERLFRAGWKQWGLAMQDDLADALRWGIERGVVDPKRVCIVGASYGGYAALMGAVRHPSLYQCASSFAGVTDIGLMFSSARADFTRNSRRYLMPQMIGDPETDAAMLRAASPIERVAEIRIPVQLVQGTLDRRVPREHADRFEAAARRAGVAIERVDYSETGHGWYLPEQQADYLTRLSAFLAKSLDRP